MRLTMTLLSDAIPGSGEGIAGIIDSDITYDEYGLPYIPAKRIKGILRESALELKDATYNFGKNDIMKKFFGEGGQNNGVAFRISDGILPDAELLRDSLSAIAANDSYKDLLPLFNREAVLDYYTYTRSQTTINKNGVAQKNSLRTFRVLRKGLYFDFDVICPDGSSNLEAVVKVTRHFGTSRTRGVGEIKLELTEGENAQPCDVRGDELNDEAECRLSFTIHNLGQLLVSSQVGKSQETETFIPGSFLLGAFAGRYAADKTGIELHRDVLFRALFLDGSVTFNNAYPCPKDWHQEFLPSPNSFVKEKDREKYWDMRREGQFEKLLDGEKQTKGKLGGYVHIKHETVAVWAPATEMEYHHARPENDRGIGHATNEKGDFYQFNVLKADQYFKASIDGKYEHIKKLKVLLEKDSIIFLGKSKTAQYGKCQIINAVIKPVRMNENDCHDGDELLITLESDMVLKNENGFYTTDPKYFLAHLRETLTLDKGLEIKESFLETKQIGGFRGVWNMPKIQAPALAAGSEIILINNSERELKLSDIESQRFGLRTEEGFGKIKCDWHKCRNIIIDRPLQKLTLKGDLSAVGEFFHFILLRALEDNLNNNAVEKFNNVYGRVRHVSKSFIGRLIQVYENSSDFAMCNVQFDFKKKAREYLSLMLEDLFITISEENTEEDLSGNGEATEVNTERKEGKKVCYKVNEEVFKGIVTEELPSEKKPAIKDCILGRMQVTVEDIFNEIDLFTLYKKYSLHFLKLVQLAKRKEA